MTSTRDASLTDMTLTLYEETAVIGYRARQLANGAPPVIEFDTSKYYSVNDIAEMEYNQHKLDLYVERVLPDGRSEYIHVPNVRIYNRS